MRFLFAFSCFLLSLQPVFAQTDTNLKMEWLAKAKPTTNLFVHFDKNVYTNNEEVYFTGYLIKAANTNINKHQILAVCLVRDLDTAVIAHDKFIMDKGLSFGSLTIPDSILTGNYHFLAYTDVLNNGMPVAIFNQAITIKTNIDPPFKASLKVVGANKGTNEQQVLLAVTSTDNRFLPKPTSIAYSYGMQKKSAKTDASGQCLINIKSQNNLADPNLYVHLKNDKDSTFISLPLPELQNRASVKFYPEGGNLVNGLPGYIGWEVKDQHRMPMALKAILYRNNNAIDTIETSSYGIGKFLLVPFKDAKYSLKLIHSEFKDSVYFLPNAIDNGLNITLKNALANDTLSLTISSYSTKKLNILLHNFQESFEDIPFEMTTARNNIKIPLSQVPKGLTTLTILDSLYRPLAERLFFAHYNANDRIDVRTDKQVYQQREKINLNLKLTNDSIGLVSIACVQENRIEQKKATDIESYTYLNNELNEMPIVLKGTAYKETDYLNQVLLIKGWRRYTWQDLKQVKPSDTLVKMDSVQMIGRVTKGKKELKQAISIGTFGTNNINVLNTADNGSFNFINPELILPQGKRSYLFVNDKNKLAYEFHINDQFIDLNKKLAKSVAFNNAVLPSTLVNNATLVLKGNEKAIRLKEVVIKTTVDNRVRNPFGGLGSNACGDYVCMYNILNCQNHRNDSQNTSPVKGVTYRGSNTPYAGCQTNDGDDTFVKFKGIHQPKEFYLNDYKDPQEPAFFSTIYWNYGVVIKRKEAIDINFYTSDITGKFKLIVQGIGVNNVLYGEKTFEVKPKAN